MSCVPPRYAPPSNCLLPIGTNNKIPSSIVIGMSDTPSWLTEENVSAAAKNPAVQKAGKQFASDPAVQKAAKNAAKDAVAESTGYEPPKFGDEEAQVEEPSSNEGPEPIDIPPEELKQMQKWSLGLRICFMGASALMAAAAVLRLQNASLSTFFVCCYVFFFSVLICCFELALRSVARFLAQNFGFLYSALGRCIFLVFVAALCFDLQTIGIAAMCVLLLLLCVNLYVLFQFPKYEKWLRHKHFTNISSKK